MARSRLSTCLDDGSLGLPPDGRIAVYGARADTDLDALPQDRCDVITPNATDHATMRARGWTCLTGASGDYAAAIVVLPRARDLGRAWLRDAALRTETGAPIIVDGQKTDGAEAVLKVLRTRVGIDGQISKAHGKLFWFANTDDFADWPTGAAMRNDDGFLTAPGGFSADGIDPGSRLLADTLPARLGPVVVDLGAGWGYLAARLQERAEISALHLVENDACALDCARQNVTDPRAVFHWADATAWRAPGPVDAVITNPPFHTGRSAEPDLGRAFLQNAARILKPSGQLWVVANRHLPYEATLASLFQTVAERGGDARYKVIEAQKPKATRGRTA